MECHGVGMQVVNLKQQHRDLYAPRPGRVEIVEVPEMAFLMIDGQIEKGASPDTSPGFAEAMAALYGMAYTLRFSFKKRSTNPVDYPVMALEGLWTLTDIKGDAGAKDNWTYTLMILVPDVVTQDDLASARAQLDRKKPSPANSRVRLERFREGLCVQALHVGPYATEPETLERMRAHAETHGYVVGHGHHEIYLGDPRRAATDKLRTILRYPLQKDTDHTVEQ